MATQPSHSLFSEGPADGICNPHRPCPRCSLVMVVGLRFDAFHAKFGRLPEPDEPLFFDPDRDHPTLASPSEIRDQVIAAASTAGLKASRLLRQLGLNSIRLGATRSANAGASNSRTSRAPKAGKAAGRGLGELIRRQRRQLDLTQQELASRIGTSVPYIGHLETGKRRPSDKVVTKLAETLRMDPRELYLLANPATKDLVSAPAAPDSASTWELFLKDQRLRQTYNITAEEIETLSQVAMLGEVRSSLDYLYILNTIRQALGKAP